MRALVTGGCGFIGSHLVDRLLAGGYAVDVVDDFSSGRTTNLTPSAAPTASTSSPSIASTSAPPSSSSCPRRRPQVVFHLAAPPSAGGRSRRGRRGWHRQCPRVRGSRRGGQGGDGLVGRPVRRSLRPGSAGEGHARPGATIAEGPRRTRRFGLPGGVSRRARNRVLRVDARERVRHETCRRCCRLVRPARSCPASLVD